MSANAVVLQHCKLQSEHHSEVGTFHMNQSIAIGAEVVAFTEIRAEIPVGVAPPFVCESRTLSRATNAVS